MELKNIAVVGPRGRVGSEIVKKLLEDGHFNVSALIRPTSDYSPPKELGSINVLTVDFEDSAALANALRNQDAVVCCVSGGQTKFAPQKLLIDAAIEAGVKLFFPSEFISDVLGPHFRIFPTQFVGEKVKVRGYLEEMAAKGKIAYTALNGGPMFDLWLMKGPGGFDIAARKAKIYGSGNNLSCWTPLPVVASAAVNMLRNPDAIKNRGIFVSGVLEVTQNAILDALEAETGAKFDVEHVDLKPIKENALAALERGDYAQATRGLAINANFNEEDSAANFWDRTENDLVGVKAVTVQEAVKAAMDAWEGK